MKRYDIINKLISYYKYEKYLEIGTQADVCLREIDCDYKVGVDPRPVTHDKDTCDKFYQMTSDDFFLGNRERFDIIFIDGLHWHVQAAKDISNSLAVMNTGGTIVIHDCNPRDEDSQTSVAFDGDRMIIPHLPTWNGDVWKAWVRYRANRPDLRMYVVDADEGCGIIQRGAQELITPTHDYKEFAENKNYYLNLHEDLYL